MSGGAGWKGLYGDAIKVEYSTEVPPVSPTTWTEVPECKSGTNNSEESQTDDFTNWQSIGVDERTGLQRFGNREFVANFLAQSATHQEIIDFKASNEQRSWRVTYPLMDQANSTNAFEIWTGQISNVSIDPSSAEGGANAPITLTFTVKINGDYNYNREAA